MDRVNATQARETFSDTIDRVRYTGQRIVVRKRGKDVAAIVSLADLAAIEAMDDRADADAARAVLRNPNTRFVPYADARKATAKAARPARPKAKAASRKGRA